MHPYDRLAISLGTHPGIVLGSIDVMLHSTRYRPFDNSGMFLRSQSSFGLVRNAVCSLLA
jgi:hypothetical protein